MVLHVQALHLGLYQCVPSYAGILQEFHQTSFRSHAAPEANLLFGVYSNELACQRLQLPLSTLFCIQNSSDKVLEPILAKEFILNLWM